MNSWRSLLKEQDQKKIEDAIMATTPVSKYESIEEWYKEFKKQMRREIKR